MSEFFHVNPDYVEGVPEHIQDIVYLRGIRYHLHDPVAQAAFDWWVQYVTDNNKGKKPKPKKQLPVKIIID